MLVEVKSLSKSYPLSDSHFWFKKHRRVIDQVSFSIMEGECLGLVGESGSGKSTLGRLLLGIESPDSGTVRLAGKPVRAAQTRRNTLSAVFQDYTSSINPNMTVWQAITEPLQAQRLLAPPQINQRVSEVMQRVGLAEKLRVRYPHELSGGQIQRLCIARAIATQPRFIVLDEAISSLDIPSQVQILELLLELKKELKITYFFITHDIQAAAYLCDRVLFLYQGQVVEQALFDELHAVRHNYARKLLASVMTF